MFKPLNKRDARYSETQARLMWNAVAYNTCRNYAFYDGNRWLHCDEFFNDFNNFYKFLLDKQVSDVHVKALPDGGGREWVVDVDFKENNARVLDVKIAVAKKTFQHFYGDSVARIMHSGNRGVHVWLRMDRFRINANKSFRVRMYKVFVKPDVIVMRQIKPGSFAHSLKVALESEDIRVMLTKLNIIVENAMCDDDRLKKLMHEFWPTVDAHVFCNFNQIRAPFSFNHKGNRFSHELK
ncbi:lef1 protein [Gynaephora ruoergensis nucleopolyhedrovirus]|nr:lef1 protein [Gynaephora ruoergensis nucleopolyhedrovirus]